MSIKAAPAIGFIEIPMIKSKPSIMAQKQTEKQKAELNPTNTRLWVVTIVFLLTFQNIFLPKAVLVRFIGNLWYGMIFQFLPTLSEPWQLIQQGLTYLVKVIDKIVVYCLSFVVLRKLQGSILLID